MFIILLIIIIIIIIKFYLHSVKAEAQVLIMASREYTHRAYTFNSNKLTNKENIEIVIMKIKLSKSTAKNYVNIS